MPKIIIPVEYTDDTISRLVVKSILKQLMFNTVIDNIEDIIYMPRTGSQQAMSQMNKANEPIRLTVNDFLKVEYSDAYDTDVWDITKYELNYLPIFVDKKLGILATPTHSKMKLTLDITYQTKSYNTAINWLNGFRSRMQLAIPGFIHEIEYYYTLPDPFLAYLQRVYTAREAKAPYNETAREYILSHISRGLNTQHNQSTASSLVMAVRNSNILGNFSSLPETPIFQKDPPVTSVTFTYVVEYERVNALLLEYQHYVHNQELNLDILQYYGDRRPHSDPLVGLQPAANTVALAVKNDNDLRAYRGNGAYFGDGWRPFRVPSLMVARIDVPILIDEVNPTNLANIGELEDFGIPLDLGDALKRYHDRITKPGEWFVYIEGYKVNEEESFLIFDMDDSGEFIASNDPNLRDRHYIRVLANYDFSRINIDGLSLEDLLLFLHWLYPDFDDSVFGGEFIDGEWIGRLWPNATIWRLLIDLFRDLGLQSAEVGNNPLVNDSIRNLSTTDFIPRNIGASCIKTFKV